MLIAQSHMEYCCRFYTAKKALHYSHNPQNESSVLQSLHQPITAHYTGKIKILQQSKLSGGAFGLLYVLNTAIALTYIENISSSINPLLLLWLTAIVATIAMHFCCYRRLGYIYNAILAHKKIFIIEIVTVFFIVLSSYFSCYAVGAALYILGYFAISGLIALFLTKPGTKNYRLFFSAIFCYSIVIIFIFKLMSIYPHGILAITITSIGAISGVIYLNYSKKRSQTSNLSALEVLAVRYLLVIMIIPVVVPQIIYFNLFAFLHNNNIIQNSLVIIMVATTALILPLYFNQKALHHLHYTQVALINALTPTVTLILSFLLHNHSMLHEQIALLCLITFIASYSSIKITMRNNLLT